MWSTKYTFADATQVIHKQAQYDEKIGEGRQTTPADGVLSAQTGEKPPQDPAVGIFGGVAPSGVDAEEGLPAPRDNDEEAARDMERKEKGTDPWAVRFDPGDKANPKVSRASPSDLLSISRPVELGRQVPMVSYSHRRTSCAQLNLRVVSSVRCRDRHGRLLRIQSRSRCSHDLLVCCWILCRSSSLGSALRIFRPPTCIYRQFCGLHLLPSRMCTRQKHGINPSLPLSRWMLRVRSSREFWRSSCGYLEC